MRHPQRLIFSIAALITVGACKAEGPATPPPPKVQAVSTRMAEFTEGVDTVSTLEASNLVELAAQSAGRILELKIRFPSSASLPCGAAGHPPTLAVQY